ncbi:MAG: efflux RND transporter permease subunit [Pseudomonadota bacterium]
MRGSTADSGIIAWFARNSVAANLLMWVIIISGIISVFTIRKQTTPDFEINIVHVQIPYLGAAPAEVEEGVVIKVEEAVQDIQGIKEIRSVSSEGMGSVFIEVLPEIDLDQMLADVKTRVDAISTFPALTEKPVIYKVEAFIPIILIDVYGDMDPVVRKQVSQQVRDEILALPEVSNIELWGNPDFEISIEVSEHVLREYGLTMSEISQAIRDSSVDMPGGSLRTDGGDILLRTEGQVYTGDEFAELVLRTYPDGTRLKLGDIAEINDGFVEAPAYARFNGQPSASLFITVTGAQNELDTAAAVKGYVEEKRASLPAGVNIDYWVDRSFYLKDRLELMLENMGMGAILVFLVLSLFLRMKVALWVIVGIPITFLGTLALMPYTPWPVTLNMVSLFGFIVVLGIVVDDAIIIGESIYTKIRADGHTVDNVIMGARKVALPATFGVLTTIAAFAPMMFVGGVIGPFFVAMAMVVILCLCFSLVESKLILPAHLVHANIKPIDEEALFAENRERVSIKQSIQDFFHRLQRRTQRGMHRVIENRYRPLVKKAIDAPGVTVIIFVAMLIITVGVVSSGIVRFVVFPESENDFINAKLQMEGGTAPEVRDQALNRIESSLLDLNAEFLAENPGDDQLPMIRHIGVYSEGDIQGDIWVELPMDSNRPFTVGEVSSAWRERVGSVPGVKELVFDAAQNFGGGAPIQLRVIGNDFNQMQAAAEVLGAELAKYDGVFDVRNSAESGTQEIKLEIKPEAEALGLTMASLGRQVRQAFYGEEAQRIQRGKDDVRVMIRYPREDRKSIADLENMRIRTTAGDEVPFESVADVSFGNSFTSIRRNDRQRSIIVSADVDLRIAEPDKIARQVASEVFPTLAAQYVDLRFALHGNNAETGSFIVEVGVAFLIALALIYVLIAIPLKSYGQPLIIMSVIPFGFIGAVIGHIMMGEAISAFSMFGLVALTGVVVNDSLILVDFINQARSSGVPVLKAVVDSGTQRFRAIVLTSFTTAAGLLPIMFETSTQAQWVIPMAISLGFGILFATFITLFLVPSLYVLGHNFKSWILDRDEAAQPSAQPAYSVSD